MLEEWCCRPVAGGVSRRRKFFQSRRFCDCYTIKREKSEFPASFLLFILQAEKTENRGRKIKKRGLFLYIFNFSPKDKKTALFFQLFILSRKNKKMNWNSLYKWLTLFFDFSIIYNNELNAEWNKLREILKTFIHQSILFPSSPFETKEKGIPHRNA